MAYPRERGKGLGQLEQCSHGERVVSCAVVDAVGSLAKVVPVAGIHHHFILRTAN
jgi:hypothetical protein